MAGESVDRLSLREQVRRYGVLDADSLQLVAVETATSLVSLHTTGRLHGDLGPDRIVLGSDGPRVLGVEPLQPVHEGASVAEERSSDPRQAMGQARDVFGWAEAMVFAAGGVVPGGGGSSAGPTGRRDVLDPLGDLLRDCLGEAWQRPTAREMLYRLSGALPTLSGASPVGAGASPVGAGVPSEEAGALPEEAGAPPEEAVDEDVPSDPHQGPGPSTDVILPAEATGTADPPVSGPGRGRRGRRAVIWLLALALVVVLAGGGVAWRVWGGVRQRSGAPVPAATAPAGTTRGAASPRVMSPEVTSPKVSPPRATPSKATIPAATSPAATPPKAAPSRVMPSGAAPMPPTMLAARLTGRWQGTLSQSHTPQDLVVDVVLRGDRGGRITLPEVGCTGVLTVLEDQPDRVVYRDVLTRDMLGQCAPSGTATITRADPGVLRLVWVNDAPPHNSAAGLLQQG